MTEHRTLERMMFKPVADLSRQPMCLAYVNQNHFVSVWPDTGDELFDTGNNSDDDLSNKQHKNNAPRQYDQAKVTLQEGRITII